MEKKLDKRIIVTVIGVVFLVLLVYCFVFVIRRTDIHKMLRIYTAEVFPATF